MTICGMKLSWLICIFIMNVYLTTRCLFVILFCLSEMYCWPLAQKSHSTQAGIDTQVPSLSCWIQWLSLCFHCVTDTWHGLFLCEWVESEYRSLTLQYDCYIMLWHVSYRATFPWSTQASVLDTLATACRHMALHTKVTDDLSYRPSDNCIHAQTPMFSTDVSVQLLRN